MKPAQEHALIAEAFDELAPAYDVEVGGTLGAARAKGKAAKLLRGGFPPGSRVVDVGCGTGVDAVRLALGGVEVVATDISAQMVRLTRERAAARGVSGRVEARQLAASEIDALAKEHGEQSFDGAYSLFGTLNLEAELDRARTGLARLLKPNATLYAGLVNPRVLWEWTLYPALLRLDKPLKKLRPETTMRVSRSREARVPVRLYRPAEFARRFAPEFELVDVLGTNILVPPPYLDKFARPLPGLVSMLGRWEDRIERRAPWNEWGYFTLLTMRRRDG